LQFWKKKLFRYGNFGEEYLYIRMIPTRDLACGLRANSHQSFY